MLTRNNVDSLHSAAVREFTRGLVGRARPAVSRIDVLANLTDLSASTAVGERLTHRQFRLELAGWVFRVG